MKKNKKNMCFYIKVCYNLLEMGKNMAKVKVKITINNEIIEEKGILKENVLKLKDKETWI